jgi:dihydrofolate synthase/folylpolyglutamate synthase
MKINERFSLARMRHGEHAAAPADDDMLVAYAERVAAIGYDLSQFDAQVCVALLMFSEHPADLVLLEAGMGGREDSTNVIDTPALAVFTPIAMDHAAELGPTLADIARHKAGIIKRGGLAITARQAPDVMSILEATAKSEDGALYACGHDWDAYESNGLLVVQTESEVEDFPPPSLAGPHQYDNAGLAAAALMLLKPARLDRGWTSGTMLAHRPGRLQPIARGALAQPVLAIRGEVWVDAGHNAHAGEALALSLKQMQRRRQAATVAIVGMRARKDADAFIGALASAVDHVIAVPLAEAHVAPTMLNAICGAFDVASSQAPSLEAAMQNAARFPAPRVLICGSFLLASEALRLDGRA